MFDWKFPIEFHVDCDFIGPSSRPRVNNKNNNEKNNKNSKNKNKKMKMKKNKKLRQDENVSDARLNPSMNLRTSLLNE